MEDMKPEDIAGEYQEHVLTYFEGFQRQVLVTDIEAPYPDGRLIVSRTDPAGVITHVNASFVAMSGYTEQELICELHSILRHPDMPAVAFKDLWDTVAAGKKVEWLREEPAQGWRLLLGLRHSAGFFLAEAYEDLSDAIKKNLRMLIRSQIQVIEHVLLIGPRLADRHGEMLNALITMRDDEKGPGVLNSLGFQDWEAVDREDTEFMIDLMDTLVS